MAAELTDEQIKRVADRLWEMGEISSMNPITAVTFARAILALATTTPAQETEPVAYLDIGAGGYLDIGSDLHDEQLARLPRGRHMLAIVGTYGADGYVPRSAPPPTAEVEKKAARYDWLRTHGDDERVCDAAWRGLLNGGDLDAAIDAALQSEQAKAGKENSHDQ